MTNVSLPVGHDAGYYLRHAGTGGVGYYHRGDEPPGVWAGSGAARMGLSGEVDPKQMMALYHELVTPAGEKLYGARAPGYVTGKDDDKLGDAVTAAVAEAGPFLTPAEKRVIAAKVRSSTSQEPMSSYLSGSRPAASRRNNPGSSLRRARSPVAPNTTRTWLPGRGTDPGATAACSRSEAAPRAGRGPGGDGCGHG
jgi:hypothetical protein